LYSTIGVSPCCDVREHVVSALEYRCLPQASSAWSWVFRSSFPPVWPPNGQSRLHDGNTLYRVLPAWGRKVAASPRPV